MSLGSRDPAGIVPPGPTTAERRPLERVERARRAAVAVSWRGLLVGVALMVLNGFFQFSAEPMRQVWLTNAAPFGNVIFLLFLLTALNALVARLAPRLALRSPDLIAIYVMLSIQTGLASAHVLHWLIGTISYGPWDKSDFLPHLPPWLLVTDLEALKGYHYGQSTFFTPRHLHAWLTPLLAWTCFVWALAAVLAAVAVLLSRQWVRRERLSFPVVELTFQMVSEGSPFWRQRLMWAGFALAAGAELINGLNYLYPSVPQLPIRRMNIGRTMTEPPWNALGETNISFYPFIIGLSFLIPLDLSMSLWVFYLFHKAQLFAGAVMGWSEIPQYPFTRDQQFGAGTAILMVAMWASRDHLRRVWRLAWASNGHRATSNDQRRREDGGGRWSVVGGQPQDEEEQEEGRQYRRALITLAVGTVVIPGFMMAAGLTWWVALFAYAMLIFMGLMVSRIRCELGFSMHQMPRMSGPNLLLMADGAQNLGMKQVSVLGLFNSFTGNHQSHIMPHQFEGLKLADREGARLGGIVRAMGIAILIAVPATLIIYLEGTYRLGAFSAHIRLGRSGEHLWEQILPSWTGSDVYRQPNLLSMGIMAGSFAVAYGLMLLRLRFLGWPLHPLGLAVANSSADLGDVVCAVFVASALKGVILHYGGLKTYRQALPFFLGLMLGDLVMGMTWVAGGILFRTPTYVFFL